jgi:hypothetical protein
MLSRETRGVKENPFWNEKGSEEAHCLALIFQKKSAGIGTLLSEQVVEASSGRSLRLSG